MRRFVFFLKKTYLFALFVVLEAVVINYYADSTGYTRARAIAASHYLTGGVNLRLAKIERYIGLRRENDALVEEIARLRGMMAIEESTVDSVTIVDTAYFFTTATVVTNTVMRPQNIITLDKGSNQGVEREMAVVTPEGSIVGYVMEVRENMSVAISLLNTEFRTSGRIKGKDYLGSILWEGRDRDHATLSEIQKYAELQKGDTVVTDYSSRFPRGMIIGTVEDWEMTNLGYFNVCVHLATRFENLYKILLLKYPDITERLQTEQYNTQTNTP